MAASLTRKPYNNNSIVLSSDTTTGVCTCEMKCELHVVQQD